MDKDFSVDPSYAIKKVQKHKIKTDTGIEITFPSGYIEEGKYIDVRTNHDGTMSIEIKNVGKIKNT